MDAERETPRFHVLLVLGALAVAAVSARPYAGGWNDGSRLASVEAIVDHGTLAIDRSVFVNVPPELVAGGHSPYDPADPSLAKAGTRDKLFIRGHYYSDKPPVASVLIAIPYKIWLLLGGPHFAESPAAVCWFLTLIASGLAYVVAVSCTYRIALRVGLSAGLSLGLAAGLGLSTVALPYTRHVNNHILLLTVTSALMLQFVCLRDEAARGRVPAGRTLLAGTLAGLGYTLDLGLGPALLACALGLVAFRCRSVGAVAAFTVGALPWLLLHHTLNYLVGGTIGPANSVPAYLDWPGSPFDTRNMTGVLRLDVGRTAVYALALLFGKHGFVLHNLPLCLSICAAVCLLARRGPNRPEVVFAAGWCTAGWLAYAVFSNNYGGACCSIRWFVPFLAPGFYILAEWLHASPADGRDYRLLAAWGAVLGAIMWWYGPFIRHMVPMYWPVVAGALLSCGWCRRQARRSASSNRDGQSAAFIGDSHAVLSPRTEPRTAA